VNSPLLRGITRGHLLALVINCVVGSGVLGLPSVLYAKLGIYVLPAWGAAALVVAAITLCFAEVGSRFPATGGAYLYAREAFGPTVGFLTGWLSMLTRILAFATVCNLLVVHVAAFRPAVGQGVGRALLVCAVAGVWSVVLAVGVRQTAWVGSALTAVKVMVLLGVGLICALWGGGLGQVPTAPVPGTDALLDAALMMMFAFAGFEAAAVPGGEMKDPARDLPRALLMGLLLVTGLYVLVQYAAIATLPDLAAQERPVSAMAARVLGPGAGELVDAGAIVMLSGTMLTQLLSTSRLLFAFGADGELPAWLGAVQPATRTPVRAIVVTGLAAAGATLASDFVSALTITVTTRVLTYAVVAIALIVLRRRPNAPPAAFLVPMGPAVAVLATLASLTLLWRSSARETGVTLGLSCVGLGLHALARYGRGR
jgi:APA family basic amino acid/polyamine antiporter